MLRITKTKTWREILDCVDTAIENSPPPGRVATDLPGLDVEAGWQEIRDGGKDGWKCRINILELAEALEGIGEYVGKIALEAEVLEAVPRTLGDWIRTIPADFNADAGDIFLTAGFSRFGDDGKVRYSADVYRGDKYSEGIERGGGVGCALPGGKGTVKAAIRKAAEALGVEVDKKRVSKRAIGISDVPTEADKVENAICGKSLSGRTNVTLGWTTLGERGGVVEMKEAYRMIGGLAKEGDAHFFIENLWGLFNSGIRDNGVWERLHPEIVFGRFFDRSIGIIKVGASYEGDGKFVLFVRDSMGILGGRVKKYNLGDLVFERESASKIKTK